jgi:tetratricopeptide (TPR) repeat protein
VKRTAAQLAEARGELAAAAALWEAVAAMEPFDLEAVRATARLLQATRDGAAAVAFLHRAVERHPHHQGLARVHAEWLGDAPAEEREPAIRRILEANPADAWAWRELALVLSWAQRAEEARAAVARAAEIEPAAPALHSVRAIALANTGEVAAAKDALREAIRLSVDEDWAVRELLRLSADAEERRRHLAFLHDEILRQVNAGDGLLAYQRAAAGVLEPGALLEDLQAAHAARPDLWHAWVALGRQLAQTAASPTPWGCSPGRGAVRAPPRIWLELGLAHRADGDRTAQREALERAVALAPAWPEAVMKLAELLHSEREFAAERALLSRATARAPTDAVLRGWLADACWAAGDREAAVEALEHALRLDPSYAWAWMTLVRFCGELGRPETPRAVAERSAAERPHDAAAWVLAGRARDTLDGKLEALDRALALAPRYATAHELRVEALADAGRLDDAVAAARPEAYGGSPPRTLRLAGARLQVARGEPGVARLELEALLAAEPDYADGWAQLTEWHAEAGRHVDAAAAPQGLVRRSPTIPSHTATSARAARRRRRRARPGGAPARAGARARLPVGDRTAPRRRAAGGQRRGGRRAPAARRGARPRGGGLRRAQIAARGGDAGAALEAFEGLARGDDRALLDRAAASLGDAGLSAALDARLDALLAAPETGRAAGALWVARSSRRGRLTRVGRRRLGQLLADARPTPAALGAAEAHVEQLALPRRALALRRLLASHGARLAGDVSAWGTAGYALSSAKRHRRAAEWLAGWRERDGVRPWMLVNLAISLRDLGREAEAREASAAALQLTRDHTSLMHEVLLACDAALGGDPGPAARLGREHEGLTGYYRFLLEMARAIAASGGADRRAAFAAARRHLRAAAAAKPDLSTEPHLRRVRRRAIARVARARAGGGALAPLWYLVARASAPRRG